ncbi:hypothetical protein Tco_0231098 [Tanacetum coccineum]
MERYSCESSGGRPQYGFDCQTGNTLVYEQVPCNNPNFGFDQYPYYSPSPPQCKVCGGSHYNFDCQTRNPLVYEPNPCNNYDLLYFNQPPQYHTDDLPLEDLDLKKIIDDLKLEMNEIMELIHERYQILKPPISFDELKGREEKVDIDLPFGEHLDTLSKGDREVNFNPSDIETNDPVPDPRMFDVPLGNDDSILDPTKSTPIIDESTLLVTPLPDSKVTSLRKVERFDPFFHLTQSGDMTQVMERHSYRFPHMPLPRQVAYSPKVVMYRYFHPNLILGDGCDLEPRSK